ncbi:conserved membrane hypothetical protein [Verrucomicrobia bacterium]|nr:conserved membrane hypothetical protein [Verrucomicrobiota bacterium]
MTYRIIGADQKEYGPVPAEELRQWFTEGRLNAHSSIKAEDSTEWKPLAALPEFADLFAAGTAPSPVQPASSTAAPALELVLARDYDLDIGGCIARGWELLQNHLWPILGTTWLVMLCVGVLNQIIALPSRPVIHSMILERRVTLRGVLIVLATSILGGPISAIFTAGLFKYFLNLIRGQRATVGDAFAGFGPLSGQLLLLGLVSGVLATLAYCLCLVPGIYLNVAWVFALPLAIDRRLGFWEALELSRKVVTRHWFLVFAFMLVNALVIFSGVIVCCVGLLVSVPLGMVAWMYAYEDIFSRQGP